MGCYNLEKGELKLTRRSRDFTTPNKVGIRCNDLKADIADNILAQTCSALCTDKNKAINMTVRNKEVFSPITITATLGKL